MSSAIITGITGQDGSYLTEFLLAKGYDVVGWMRRASTNTINERLETYLANPKFHLVEADLTDMGSVSGAYNTTKEILGGAPGEFFNLAAQSHVATSFSQKDFTTATNLLGVYHILDNIKDDGVRFLQASTSEIFGYEYDDDGTVKGQDENTLMMPNSPYAIAKLGAHHAVRMYRDGYGLHGSCSICFNHESPRRGEHFVTRKITIYVAKLKYMLSQHAALPCLSDEQNIYVNGTKYPKLRLGNIDACRDWSHAKDMVRGMWMMLQQEKPDDYVLASGETRSVRDFVRLCFDYIGIENWESYVYIDKGLYRPVEVPYLLGIADKAYLAFGWKPEYSFNDLVSDMMESDLDIYCN